jgi:hypothetical protein
MNHIKNHFAGIACSVLATLSLSASAQTNIQTVPSVEVRNAISARTYCPDLDDTIANSLARHVNRVGEAGSAEVTFVLEGNAKSEVVVVASDRRYRQALRWAMNQLSCSSDERRTLALVVEFIPSINHAPTPALRVATR